MAATRWLILAVLVVPLAALPGSWGIPIAQAKNAALLILGLGLIVWELPSVWLRAFALWAWVTFVLSRGQAWGMAGLLGVLAFLLVHRAASRLTDAQWASVTRAIGLAAAFQVAWMAVQAAGLDPIFRPLEYLTGNVLDAPAPVVGWFANPMDTALFLGLALPVLPLWLAAAVAVAIIGWLGSTAGLLCIACAGTWRAWAWARGFAWAPLRWAPPAGAAGALLALVGWEYGIGRTLDTVGMGGRPSVWASLWQLSAFKPLAGWGPNALGYRLSVYSSTGDRWDFGFNEYLQGAVEFGWIGVGLALGYLGSLLWRGRHRWATEPLTPAIAALLVLGLFSIPLRVGPAALLVALFLGRLEGRLSA